MCYAKQHKQGTFHRSFQFTACCGRKILQDMECSCSTCAQYQNAFSNTKRFVHQHILRIFYDYVLNFECLWFAGFTFKGCHSIQFKLERKLCFKSYISVSLIQVFSLKRFSSTDSTNKGNMLQATQTQQIFEVCHKFFKHIVRQRVLIVPKEDGLCSYPQL